MRRRTKSLRYAPLLLLISNSNWSFSRDATAKNRTTAYCYRIQPLSNDISLRSRSIYVNPTKSVRLISPLQSAGSTHSLALAGLSRCPWEDGCAPWRPMTARLWHLYIAAVLPICSLQVILRILGGGHCYLPPKYGTVQCDSATWAASKKPLREC